MTRSAYRLFECSIFEHGARGAFARMSSTFAELTPFSSAVIVAFSTQVTMSDHWSSPWRVAGPSGSLEMISGRNHVILGIGEGGAGGGEAGGNPGVHVTALTLSAWRSDQNR